MNKKKWATKRITVNLAKEKEIKLENYCQRTGRPATDVVRELLRTLPSHQTKINKHNNNAQLYKIGV